MAKEVKFDMVNDVCVLYLECLGYCTQCMGQCIIAGKVIQSGILDPSYNPVLPKSG